MAMENEFIKQFAGSGSANIVTLILLSIGWFVKNKCKHVKCKGHSYCCDCSIKDDYDENGGDIENQLHGRTLSGFIKEKMLQVQKINSSDVLPSSKTVI